MNAPRKKEAHLWARHPEDFYVEPEWCSERLFDVEVFSGNGAMLDPACGLGRIFLAASHRGYMIKGADIVRRSKYCETIADFLIVDPRWPVASIVSNPPFGVADIFTRRSLSLATKTALILPTKWMNSAKRGKWLETTPLKRVWLLAPRPSMPPGPVILAGEKPGNGTVDFAWFVWERGYEGEPTIGWLRREVP